VTADPEIIALPMGEHTFPADSDVYPGQTVVVVAYAIRHSGGVFLFDTGFREARPDDDAELRAFFEAFAIRTRPLPDVLAAVGIDLAEVSAVANCHLHFDQSGQNARLPGIPIYVQPPELAAASQPMPPGQRGYTFPEAYDFPGARFEPVAGDHQVAPGIRIYASPGHSPGHQSLVVDTPHGPVLLAGQAVYSRGEWIGLADAREGATIAPDGQAYRRSVARLKALKPRRVLFGHDRRSWPD